MDVGLVGNLLSAVKSKMLGETPKTESFAELLWYDCESSLVFYTSFVAKSG